MNKNNDFLCRYNLIDMSTVLNHEINFLSNLLLLISGILPIIFEQFRTLTYFTLIRLQENIYKKMRLAC